MTGVPDLKVGEFAIRWMDALGSTADDQGELRHGRLQEHCGQGFPLSGMSGDVGGMRRNCNGFIRTTSITSYPSSTSMT
jgi:hypothetical protein